MSVTTKMKQIAHDVYWGEENPDHPECPKCGERMYSICWQDCLV